MFAAWSGRAEPFTLRETCLTFVSLSSFLSFLSLVPLGPRLPPHGLPSPSSLGSSLNDAPQSVVQGPHSPQACCSGLLFPFHGESSA